MHDSVRGLFYASQDVGEEYYRLPWADRETAIKPGIDQTFYTGWNALAAESLLRAYTLLGQPTYLAVAARVLDMLWMQSWSLERGLCHVANDVVEQPPLLGDQVFFLRALLAGYQTTGDSEYLNRALAVGQTIQDIFTAPEGGYYDLPVPSGGHGDKPVLENSLLAEAWLILTNLTNKDTYLALARNTLESFQNTAPHSSYSGARGILHFVPEQLESHHYAFHVTDDEFDGIYERVKAKGLAYGSGPTTDTDGRVGDRRGGRALYFREINGHLLEVMTA